MLHKRCKVHSGKRVMSGFLYHIDKTEANPIKLVSSRSKPKLVISANISIQRFGILNLKKSILKTKLDAWYE